MKLHYSQTESHAIWSVPPVLLPYEITLLSNYIKSGVDDIKVLLPYEITLLSNKHRLVFMRMPVLLPYEITLLSNKTVEAFLSAPVLLPYEITLLSNASGWKVAEEVVLLPYEITLLSNVSINTVSISRFYYLMKLHYSQTSNENKLRHYNSQGNIIKWLYYKPKIIFLQQFRTYLYPKYKDFLAEVSESCFDFQ